MKGVITLTVEVDYTEMLKEENISVLEGFTGLKTSEDLRNHHLSTISGKIANAVEGIPFTGYNLEGKFIPHPREEKTELIDNWLSAVELEELTKVENKLATEPTEVIEQSLPALSVQNELIDLGFEEPTAMPPSPPMSTLHAYTLLEEAVDRVSMEFGIPTMIRISEEMENALKIHVAVANVESENSKITMYQGFPVQPEGMAELFIIDYKSYGKNTKESWTPNIN